MSTTSRSTVTGGLPRRGLRDITNHNSDKLGVSKAGGKAATRKPSALVDGSAALTSTTANPVAASSASNGPAASTTTMPSLMPLTSRPAESVGLQDPGLMSLRCATARPSSSALSGSSAATASSQYSRREADDIDVRDLQNPLMCTDYVGEMYSHYRQKELTTSVNPTYMTRQPHINEKMRAILVDWLVEVHTKFRCVPETLYLTINLIDRYLELEQVERSQLQLVGVTALLLASKYEEIYPPEIRELVYITDRAYSKDEILRMEERMLKALNFKVTIASPYCFLVRYLKAAHADKRMVWLACYITERVQQEYHMLKYLPSTIASAAVCLARRNLQRNPWSPTLYKYTQYTESSLRPCLQEMSQALASRSSLQAVKKKYASNKYGAVSNMTLHGV